MTPLSALGCWSCKNVENFRGRLICQLGHDVLERCEDFEYESGSDEREREPLLKTLQNKPVNVNMTNQDVIDAAEGRLPVKQEHENNDGV